MTPQDIKNEMICERDYIADIAFGQTEYRKISSFTVYDNRPDGATVHFEDGGCMGIDEIKSEMIFLESEIV